MTDIHVVLIDNHDSFVYNLVDALSQFRTTVFRNTVPVAEVLAAKPDIIVLSPGPGYPATAGSMMEIIDTVSGKIPILGICLGFQALLEYYGGAVVPCGPVHGVSVPMSLTDSGARHPVFHGLAIDEEPDQPDYIGTQVPVARYHSLGCTTLPAGLRALATTAAEIGTIIMAAESEDGRNLGMQFHPESILTPSGPLMLERAITQLISRTPATTA